MLQHGNLISHADTQGTPRAALADHHADYRQAQPTHGHEIFRYSLGYAALFGTYARISPGGVDQGNDGQVVFLCQLHNPKGLTVAFRMSAAEIAGYLLF